MLDSIYHGAFKIFKNGVFSVKRLRLVMWRNVVINVIT